MKLILAADLHFGSVPEGLALQLAGVIEQQSPDLVVIAGDLTLAARRKEFDQAKAWLAALKPVTLVLPGNHDVPYWNILQRFADPFHRYRTAAGAETLMPTYESGDAFVLGFNTTGSWQPHLRWQEGLARRGDIQAAGETLLKIPQHKLKAVVAHHPFLSMQDQPRIRPVRRAAQALQVFAEAGVDLIMSGHIHQSYAVQTEVFGRPVLAIGAPTALSLRMRGEANGFWVIENDESRVRCELWLVSGKNYTPVAEKVFARK